MSQTEVIFDTALRDLACHDDEAFDGVATVEVVCEALFNAALTQAMREANGGADVQDADTYWNGEHITGRFFTDAQKEEIEERARDILDLNGFAACLDREWVR